jgi:choline dehydrogenase-like flavoprotein
MSDRPGRIVVGTDLRRDVEERPDVCIVGSGAGGAVLAAQLAGQGARVVILEEGRNCTREDFDMVEATAYSRLYQERRMRATSDQAIAVFQGRAWGGSTVVNWATSFRPPGRVLSHWAKAHGVEGLDAEALAPHLAAVESRLGAAEWPLPRMNENNRVLWNGAGQLDFSRELVRRHVRGCEALGYCAMGCPTDARQSMPLTYLAEALSRGARAYLHARAERIERQGSRASLVRAQVRDPATDRPTARQILVRPKILVLSGGAINSPAILLRSQIDSGHQAGRRTFLHPAIASIAIHPRRIEAWSGAPQSAVSFQFSNRGPGKVGFVIAAIPAHPIQTAALLGGFGAQHQAVMAQMGSASILVGMAVDGFLPEETGGTVAIDKDGRVGLDYDIPPSVWEALREASRAMARIQLAAGATTVYSTHEDPVVMHGEADLTRLDGAPWAPGRVGLFSLHAMGGCSMGRDPSRAVVDSQLRHHQLDNLYVVDGSVFPTSLGVNPQLTINALAHRAAEHIARAIA